MGQFEHEKLTTYQHALATALVLDRVASEIPERRADHRDQLRRASASIPLNVAEGAGEFSPSEKARFYRIARRSAAECSAILDLVAGMSPSTEAMVDARPALHDLGGMLTNLVKAVHGKRR